MSQYNPIGPIREPKGHEEPKRDERIYQKYLELSHIEAQKAALAKHEEYIHSLVTKLQDEALEQQARGFGHFEKELAEVEKNLSIRWENARELQGLFSSMAEALEKKDRDKAAQSLMLITESQVGENKRGDVSFQKAFNQSLKEVLQREEERSTGAEEIAIRLYMAQMGKRAIGQWGQSLQGMKYAVLEKLEDQITASEGNETPFKTGAERLFNEIHGASDEELAQFTSPQMEKDLHRQLLKSLEDSMMAPGIKSTLQRGEQRLTERVSQSGIPVARRDLVIKRRSIDILKEHFIDESFEIEIKKLRDALWNLKQLSNLSEADKQKLAQFEQELNEAEADYNDPSKQKIQTIKLLHVLEGMGDLIAYKGSVGKDKDSVFRQNALQSLMDALKLIKETAQAGSKEIDDQIAKLDEQIKGCSDGVTIIDEIDTILERIKTGKATRDDYATLMLDYGKMSKIKNLPADMQARFDNVKKAIQSARVEKPGGGTMSLLEMMGACYIQKYAPSSLIISADDMQKWMSDMEAHANSDFSDAPDALAIIKNMLHTEGEHPPGFVVDPFSGQSLFHLVPGIGFAINKDFGKRDSIHVIDLDSLVNVSKEARTYMDDLFKKWTLEKETLEYSSKQIAALVDQIGKLSELMEKITRAVINGEDLGKIFRDYILGDYTMYLNTTLQMLGLQLQGKIFASKAYGDAASKITNWANVSTTVDPPAGLGYNSWFQKYEQSHPKGDPSKPFKIEDLKEYIDKELKEIKDLRDGAMADKNSAEKSLNDSIKQADEEAAAGKITKQEAETRKAEFKKEIESLHKTVDTLDSLKTKLENFSKNLPKDAEAAREYAKNNIKDIGTNESLCVNGDKEKNILGLNAFQTHLMETSKDNAGQGERLQMRLGQTFTNMQMNYSTITSCMQLLNRMISTPIMNLKP